MGRTYFCWKCQIRHEAPSGRNCPAELFEDELEKEVDEINRSHSTATNMELPGDDNPDVKSLASRLDGLEKMIYKLAENLSKDGDLSAGSSPAIDSSPERVSRSHKRRHHRSHSRSPSKSNTFSYDELFDQEDMKITSYSQVMVATFRSLISLYSEGTDIMGLLQHGQFMSEKASADAYVMDTFVNYDKFVRGLANKRGPSAFGACSDLDKNRYFSLENYKDVRALKSKVAKGQNKKQAVCRRFNGEAGCWAKGCNYVHKCLSCDSSTHGSSDCPALKKNKTTK